MGKVFVVDISRCSGCYNCQLACKDEHCGNEWLPYAKKQPMTGQFWAKVTEHVEGSIPKVKIHYTPEMCGHCDNPSCMAACSTGAVYKRGDGLVLIDPLKCNGCRECMGACPYGRIYFNGELNIAQKCTGCAHLLDAGKMPRCVSVCPTGALIFDEKDKLEARLKDAVQMAPHPGHRELAEPGDRELSNPGFQEYAKPDKQELSNLHPGDSPDKGCSPNLYYENLPGKFIAGTIFDPVEEEVIRDALCVLTCDDKTYETRTDFFGDFWFKNLPAGTYKLAISPAGFKAKTFDNIDLTESVNIGDIPFR